MITIIFGAPGAGKTSLMAHYLMDTYSREGKQLLKKSRERIEEVNRTRKTPLSLPEKPPIFSDFDVKFLCGYKQYFEPYFINGYYFGLKNDTMATQFLPPFSKVFLSEGQRYFDSRRNSTFQSFVSNAFEMHRHYGIDIYIDVQRLGLIDLNIRALCKRFIEVREKQDIVAPNGAILRSMFYVREWGDLTSVESYLRTGEENYQKSLIIHDGNIFDCFNSRGHFEDFLPEDGKDFTFLPFLEKDETAPQGTEAFYKTSEPKEYRMSVSEKEKKENKGRKETDEGDVR